MVSGTSSALTHNSLFLSRALNFSSRPISHVTHHTRLLPVPLQTTSIRCSSLHPFNSTHAHQLSSAFKGFPRYAAGPTQLSFHNSRVSAVPDDGSGGTGGPGGSGGWNSGGSGDGSGGDGAAGGGGGKWSLLSWYLALLGKYPVPVKAVTSAILTLIGDLICQLVIDKVQSLDLKRTFLFTLLGFVLVGPTLHFWYLYLSKLVTLPGASGALLRLVLDQFLFSPIFIGVFLATLVTLEGRPSQAVPKLKQEWFSAVLANWQLWIPFQFLNFRFVPQQFQVLAANVIALVWNVILSFKAHKEVLPK